MKFTGDFECTTDENDTRVWAWGLCVVGEPDLFYYGNDLAEFFRTLKEDFYNPTVYFHNAKYDFQFMISWLLQNNYTWIEDKRDREDFTFSTLITGLGQFYSLEVYFKVKGKKVRKVKFLDSLKLINSKVSKIAEDFHLPISKLKIDYEKSRPKGHVLTPEERDYLKNDVAIMSMALDSMFKQGLTAMTISSNALRDFKKTCRNFKDIFPKLDKERDTFSRLSYKGGFTYLNPLYREKEVFQKGIVLDKNSMYPAKLYNELLPYSYPENYLGKYENDPDYPLYIQRIACSFKLKEGKIPSIQLKNSMFFRGNEYLTSSNEEIVILSLTSVDLELFFENYDVYNLEYIDGLKFMGMRGIFGEYIDKWTQNKINSKKKSNYSLYQISKLMLNSLYGRFGLNPASSIKIPYLDEDLVVRYKTMIEDDRDPVYVALASFVTSYARADIIRSSEAVREFTLHKYGFDGYIYSDTDSIHCIVNPEDEKELYNYLDIDDYRLGAWKIESRFIHGKYLRQKCYMEEDEDNKLNVVIAGFPSTLAPLMTFDKFHFGFSTFDFDPEIRKQYGDKLAYHYTNGGVVLKPIEFTLK